MARKPWTDEQKRDLRERLAKGREAAQAKRAAAEGDAHLLRQLDKNGNRQEADPLARGLRNMMMPRAAAPQAGRLGDVGMDDPKDDGVTIRDEGPSLDGIRKERRERLTGDLPADLAALITDAELEKIESEEIERAVAAKKKQALADVRALASAEARIEHGLIPADVLRSESEKARLAEKIRVRVNLPRGGGALGLRIDGRLFRHGQSYTVTRAEYESMHYTVYKTWLDEIRFRTLDQNERGRSAIDQITANPPQFEVLG